MIERAAFAPVFRPLCCAVLSCAPAWPFFCPGFAIGARGCVIGCLGVKLFLGLCRTLPVGGAVIVHRHHGRASIARRVVLRVSSSGVVNPRPPAVFPPVPFHVSARPGQVRPALGRMGGGRAETRNVYPMSRDRWVDTQCAGADRRRTGRWDEGPHTHSWHAPTAWADMRLEVGAAQSIGRRSGR